MSISTSTVRMLRDDFKNFAGQRLRLIGTVVDTETQHIETHIYEGYAADCLRAFHKLFTGESVVGEQATACIFDAIQNFCSANERVCAIHLAICKVVQNPFLKLTDKALAHYWDDGYEGRDFILTDDLDEDQRIRAVKIYSHGLQGTGTLAEPVVHHPDGASNA